MTMTERQKFNYEAGRDLVISCLHHQGSNRRKLSDLIWCRAYLKCDGFGEIDAEFAKTCDWDWSHVRDSSPEAIWKVYNYLMDNVNF